MLPGVAIFLIRHGETSSNAARVVQLPDAPLSERGRDQARRLARRLAREGVERILTSDHTRASMTADAVARATGAPVHVDADLQERNYGALRGRPYTEVGQYIMADGYEPPEGESWDAFHARVDAAWTRVREAAAAATGNLAVVTHGLVCYSLALRHLRLPEGAEPRGGFQNTALTVIEPRPPFAVSLYRCCAHLDDGAGRTAWTG